MRNPESDSSNRNEVMGQSEMGSAFKEQVLGNREGFLASEQKGKDTLNKIIHAVEQK